MATKTYIVTITDGEKPIIREIELPQQDDVIPKAMELGYGTADKVDSMDAFIDCANWFFNILKTE